MIIKHGKRKRVCLNIQQKLRIIERLEAGEVGTKLAAEFNVGSSTITDIKKAKAKLREFAASQESSSQVLHIRKARDIALAQANKSKQRTITQMFLPKKVVTPETEPRMVLM